MSSLLSGKLEAQFAIRLAASKHHEIFSGRPQHISDMTPTKIKNCAVHEGDFGNKAAIVNWDYIHDGVHKVAKSLIEDIDDVNLSTTFKVMEGDLMKEYKEFKIVVKATPQSEKSTTSLVRWTMEYEKLNEDVLEPFYLMQFAVLLSKDVDDHHSIYMYGSM